MALRDHVGQQLSCCSCSSGVADSASPAPVHQTASVIKSPPSLVVVLGLVRIQAASVFGSHFFRLNKERKKREREEKGRDRKRREEVKRKTDKE